MNKLKLIFFYSFILIFNVNCQSENGKKLYNEYCATCHGEDLSGGNSSTLFDSEWLYGSDDKNIFSNIKIGIEQEGMPGFADVLSDEEINSLIQFIRSAPSKTVLDQIKKEDKLTTFDYDVNVQVIVEDLSEPWAIAFTDPLNAYVTEKEGNLRVIENGKLLKAKIEDIPEVFHHGQGGLLDVAVDPNYDENKWIYLSFSHEIDGKGMTKIVRGKIENYKWKEEQTLFQAETASYVDTKYHFGSRIVFDNSGNLYFSIGDRGRRDQAQDLSKPNGKIHRIKIDGTVPTDNPFVYDKSALPTIFSYGSRNAQGLAIEPGTGKLWGTEHGQKGGDELNIYRAGKNYGWDLVTYGRNYDGTVSTKEVKMPGIEVPILFWRPSIAVCGLDFYNGKMFEKWNGHLLAGALKYEEVRILDIEDERVVHQEILLKDFGRVRDVCVSPDGSIYVVLNSPGKILRLTPEK